MKKKVWASSPVFLLISAVMFAMACVSWFWNRTVFYLEVALAAGSVAAVLVSVSHFHAYVTVAAKSARTILSGDRYRAL